MERWKPITGFEGLYEVSNMGRVRSLPRTHCFLSQGKYPAVRRIRGCVLKQSLGNGYLRVELWESANPQICLVHRLVAQAFIPNPENKPQVNHLKNPKTNNAVTNLEWATFAEDLAHKMKNGQCPKGEAHGLAKLTEAQVTEIRKLYAQGFLQKQLATMHGISSPTVSSLIRGRTWKHVPLEVSQ